MPKAKLEASLQDHSSILLQLSGSWTLSAGVPDTDDLEHQLQFEAVKQVAFDTSKVSNWDSGLLT